jgi:hypothetical protein
MWTDPVKKFNAHRHMIVKIGTEAAQFPEKEYINVFAAVQLCASRSSRHCKRVNKKFIKSF